MESHRPNIDEKAIFAIVLACAIVAAFALAAARPAPAYADEPKTLPLLMIVVGFDGGDENASTHVAGRNAGTAHPIPYNADYDWHETVFGTENSLASYYLDMSGNAFTFAPADETCSSWAEGNYNAADREYDGVVHVTLHRPHGAWGRVAEDLALAQECGEVALEAFRAAAPFVDYASYDKNGDKLLTTDELAVAICVAGYDASPFDNPDRTDIPVLWPHAGVLSDFDNPENRVDGIVLDSYIAIPENLTFDTGTPTRVEQEPLGILYHELGHYLGLPDLYALNDNPESSPWGAYEIGMLSLMATGPWAEVADASSPIGHSYEPTGFDPWSRYVLGWSIPDVAKTSGDYRVASQLSVDGYCSLLIPTSDPREYFLIENRQPEGHDAGLAFEYAGGNTRGGIVIWHIDKDTYKTYGADNRVNDTDHAPAIMQQCFEVHDDSYTTDLAQGAPYHLEPFFDARSCQDNLADASIAIELPLYNDDPAQDDPAHRTESGITLSFPSDSAREMTVHVEFADETAGTASRAYPLNAAEKRALREGAGTLGKIASAALAAETSADIAIVDAGSIYAGLPEGAISWSDAYGVLSNDANIVCYDLTGAQLIEIAEQSLDVERPYRCIANALDALREFDGIEQLPTIDAIAPNADAALTFANMTYDVHWNEPSGNRIDNVAVGGAPIDRTTTYRVALAPDVVERYELFGALSPNTLLLWGTPADALRSFLEHPNWEQVAQ